MNAKALLAFIALLLAPAAAFAAPVELTSEIYVEKRSVDAAGKETVSYTVAERVVPGDRLRFVIRYRNAGDKSAADFVITNPIPKSVAYVGADGEPLPVVSVDGGKSFGDLAELRVKADDGTERPAEPGDVTHVKWEFAQNLAGGSVGQVAFRAQLR